MQLLLNTKLCSSVLLIYLLLFCLLQNLSAEESCGDTGTPSSEGFCKLPETNHHHEEDQYVQSTKMTEMKAVRVEEFGDESKLKLIKMAIPTPEANQILIKVEAVGLNPVECMIRLGYFGNMIKPPYVPGTDVAGTVEAVGSGVTKFKKGDRVYAIKSTSGAYAQFCTAPVDYVSPLHASLSFSQGAALGLPYTVAYKALFIRGQSKKGETVLVHGASGGVGSAAVQMAKANGLTVIGTAGSKEGMDLVKQMGADHVFNHKDAGYMEKIKEAAGGKGPNVILEMLANKNLIADLGIIHQRGRIVVIGNKGPMDEKFDAGLTMGTESSILGLVIQVSTPEEYKEMMGAIDKGQGQWLKPHVSKEYKMEDIAQAHKDLFGSSATVGKLILKPNLKASVFGCCR